MAKKIIFLFCCATLLIGCATLPPRETLPTYSINGSSYVSLISLCQLKRIEWDYDTFTRTAVLAKDEHRINLRVGERMVLVDGLTRYLNHPVELYQGTVVVPYRFKEQIIDILFRRELPSAQAPALPLKIKKIVIDPGHGGTDPGAIGRRGLREKDVNLDVAKRLATLLRRQGVEVTMTRTVDKFISLQRRVDIANSSGADLFLSLHSNANRVRGLNGLEVYYVSPKVSDSQRALSSAKDASLALGNAQIASSSLNLKAILWDMIYTSNRAESIVLSRSICRAINRQLDTKVIGVKGGNFYVLKGARIPAVLIEIGFLSNYNEERLLRNSYYRQQMAEAIAQGIENYARDYTLAYSGN
ncbi:MAG: N-acetylmuramoyl-L-alanine amidase [Candidatus Omnitrophica bacterium]|nr:N-acetylmuramoyl-L-alanine amidase [Candidatus Omnitrophota bacterium]